ncbi:PQQ-binding-like beta-propeller repeat protein [Sphingomonas cannabina]|uniref:PQQ-binding-like beta-propeller repeat protein n=1 Tax=Sphingomonas cannabina TaxID=2899123 RepID=UPI001F32DBA1|nr:PQQ-binding-like beta-propeller repeat protein [Sphingomonas cannabina]UIJ44699.1 PQQ-binding-like beta-propeller repeat protein [Sphingomonas cannabina]
MRKFVTACTALALVAGLSGCGVFKGGKKKTPVLGERVPILMSENSISPDKSIAAIEVVLPPPAANESWNQPGGNAAKSMGHLALADAPRQIWRAQIPGGDTRVRLAAAPTVDGGKLFVMDTEGAVHAFDANTGAKLWTVETAAAGKDKKEAKKNARARFGGGASAEGGKVFATNGLGDVVALDASNGAVLWRAKPGGPLRGAPTLANGNIYVLSQDNQLFALNQADGSVVWTQAGSLESQGVFGVAAPAAAQGTVVAGFSSGELNAYRYENGSSVWADTLSRSSISTSVSSLSDIDAEPVIDQGRAYAVGQGGRMVALELVTGQRLWEQNLAGISTPWVAGEWIFVVTDDARLICLARASGKIRWISQLRKYRKEKKQKDPIAWIGPVLAGGKLWLANSQGQIVSASPTDGTVGYTLETKGRFGLPLMVANSTLYSLNDKGGLTAYR